MENFNKTTLQDLATQKKEQKGKKGQTPASQKEAKPAFQKPKFKTEPVEKAEPLHFFGYLAEDAFPIERFQNGNYGNKEGKKNLVLPYFDKQVLVRITNPDHEVIVKQLDKKNKYKLCLSTEVPLKFNVLERGVNVEILDSLPADLPAEKIFRLYNFGMYATKATGTKSKDGVFGGKASFRIEWDVKYKEACLIECINKFDMLGNCGLIFLMNEFTTEYIIEKETGKTYSKWDGWGDDFRLLLSVDNIVSWMRHHNIMEKFHAEFMFEDEEGESEKEGDD